MTGTAPKETATGSSAVDPATHHASEAERAAYAQGWVSACHQLAGVADEWAAENARMTADAIAMDMRRMQKAFVHGEMMEVPGLGQDCIIHSAMVLCAELIATECRKRANSQPTI